MNNQNILRLLLLFPYQQMGIFSDDLGHYFARN